MSHLSTERLAALADERPTADEQTHLARCALCTAELNAHRSLLSMASTERETMGIPLTRWDTLARQLRAEGLISTDQPVSVTAEWAAPIGRRLSTRSLLRVAAAIMLVVSGTVIGRASTGASIIPGGVLGIEPAPAVSGLPDSAPSTFASLEEARRFKDLYADAYQNAVSYLAANDSSASSTESPAVMRTRLSALDRVSRTMREALNTAPYDPVINDFYLSSFGQREATLRQLNTVLPEGVRLNSF
jgi:hypothetical protein